MWRRWRAFNTARHVFESVVQSTFIFADDLFEIRRASSLLASLDLSRLFIRSEWEFFLSVTVPVRALPTIGRAKACVLALAFEAHTACCADRRRLPVFAKLLAPSVPPASPRTFIVAFLLLFAFPFGLAFSAIVVGNRALTFRCRGTTSFWARLLMACAAPVVCSKASAAERALAFLPET